MKKTIKKYNYPDSNGYFGQYGGRLVPPQLEKTLLEVEQGFEAIRNLESFQSELQQLYRNYVGRPSLLYEAKRLSQEIGGARIFLKREDLNHTGAHKINNALGQALVAKHLGKKKLIAETGAGQHGVAVATVAAYFGMTCEIYMGARDIKNQKMNVYRMQLLGAKIIPVTQGQGTLKDAVDVALNAFIQDSEAYYLLGSAVGPHPYPLMVREFQKVIGIEAKEQMLQATGKLPDYAVACVGGGSNAIGLFSAFIEDSQVNLIAAEPAGKGEHSGHHGLSLLQGKPGSLHGFSCLVLQDDQGNIKESYSAASGLDYPGVGPEHCLLQELGRLQSLPITDEEAVSAFQLLSKTEGIIPALESAHALAAAEKIAKEHTSETTILVNLSGRGDKDVENICEHYLASPNLQKTKRRVPKTSYNNQDRSKNALRENERKNL